MPSNKDPEKRRATARRWYAKNKARVRATRERYIAKDPERFKALTRRIHLKQKFGLTEDQYADMLCKQGGACAICGRVAPAHHGRSLCVDHDHRSGKVRALLCGHCNSLLGHARDSTEVLTLAIQYLRLHASQSAT